MKKIFLKGYLIKNLGDDLFIKIISERYPQVVFDAYSLKKYNKNIFKQKNLNLYFFENFITKVINMLFFKMGIKKSITREMKNDYLATVIIGGSLFIETEKFNSSKYLNYNYKFIRPYYILGSNFGPYFTQEYLEVNKENIIKKAEDVCFRDNSSYILFNDLNNVRIASDVVFSMDLSHIKITEEDKVVISVIDCCRKVNPKYKIGYENKIIELIKYFIKKDYNITLMSFCKSEGDEEVIERIIKKFNNQQKNKIKKHFYRGDINEAINELACSKIIIGTRFHANILGLKLNKTIIPIAYSDKTINVLKDMNFKGKIFDIRKLEDFNITKITDQDLSYKIEIKEQVESANQHFYKLDKLLKETD
ncbi:polysaccharide pyruvyl transferase family protein [Turicibacter faecis]|uniref:polysaccharide pyruvyl transferase family protein n=1 Tax=Turicibacter faecis TaxID=2963365 RepID=UPI0030CFE63E